MAPVGTPGVSLATHGCREAPGPACPVLHLPVSGTRSDPVPQPGVTLLLPAQGGPAEPGTAWSPPCNCSALGTEQSWARLELQPGNAQSSPVDLGLVPGFVTGCPHGGTAPAARRELSAGREGGAVPRLLLAGRCSEETQFWSGPGALLQKASTEGVTRI